MRSTCASSIVPTRGGPSMAAGQFALRSIPTRRAQSPSAQTVSALRHLGELDRVTAVVDDDGEPQRRPGGGAAGERRHQAEQGSGQRRAQQQRGGRESGRGHGTRLFHRRRASRGKMPPMMAPQPASNLFRDARPPAHGERFDTLLHHRNLLVERIVSAAGTTPTAYVQPQDEWVVLLQGAATLTVDGRTVELAAGDHLFIPARTPHTVERTSQGALWLAVHLHAQQDDAPRARQGSPGL
ncbi:cupin domain-containing protein [Xylophilus sp.]|uniref:cupin domain-containing protein n=1 Tax=Xylophilus sp. TaxID=2653893 RepID=UPI002D80339D|nr:cupin domain-containing protein [Xylophilus sp.]